MNNSNNMWGQFSNIEEYYIDENVEAINSYILNDNYTLKPIHNVSDVYWVGNSNNSKTFYYGNSYIVKIINGVLDFANFISNL